MFHVEHMDANAFRQVFNVPRGTMDRLECYANLVADWQTRMNLVGPSTLDDMWSRHFADSAQLAALVPQGRTWLDIGAGAGFPGMVLAAMEWGNFILVDSITKKCRFLEQVRSDLALTSTVDIRNARVEELPALGVEIVTARAAAPLPILLEWALRHLRPQGQCVFPKGRSWPDEVAEAETRFSFDLQTFPSMTDGDARILVASNVKRR